ncbi:hypothetical protein DOTSEDRAFT_74369 [Dothistroma septosporum NZE10]|uniref:Uncharacterized protein n=1 Tax=Dothistroma septosporum (strain NZE10 / CBS 128990) TaxID=675120 RepID=N1PDV3_DOTSN|nr:hypothetical protein DOTSEDRAFT_74369 [Dothistroma septosporum NZE10]
MDSGGGGGGGGLRAFHTSCFHFPSLPPALAVACTDQDGPSITSAQYPGTDVSSAAALSLTSSSRYGTFQNSRTRPERLAAAQLAISSQQMTCPDKLRLRPDHLTEQLLSSRRLPSLPG